jgi:hypothetical protein
MLKLAILGITGVATTGRDALPRRRCETPSPVIVSIRPDDGGRDNLGGGGLISEAADRLREFYCM